MTLWTWADAHPAGFVILAAPCVVTLCALAFMVFDSLLRWSRR